MKDYGYDEEGRGTTVGDYRLWSRIFSFCSHHIGAMVGAITLSLAITAATLGLPYIIQTCIDGYITNLALPMASRLSGIGTLSIIFFGLVVTVLIATFYQVVILEWIGQSIMHRIRQDLFAHMLQLDLPFFDSQPTGRLVTRLTNDIQNMHEMFTSVLVTIFNDFLRLGGILVVLYLINFRLALVMSLFVPLAAFLTIIFARLARAQFRRIRSQLAKLNSFLSEAISGIFVLQLFGRKDSSRALHDSLSKEYLHRNLDQIKLFGTFMPLTEFMSSAAIALILWYGGAEILKKQLTLGELVASLSYMRLFFQPLRELAQKYSIVQSAMASAERIFQLFDTTSKILSPPQPAPREKVRGELHFDDVSFAYDEKNPVLERINLKIIPGQTMALVGTTGSGKSTLVNLLLRFYEPQHGRITIDGRDIGEFALADLRQMVGVVLQDIFILHDTLLANIVMDTGTGREEVIRILKQTGMERFVNRLPKGLDTMIGEGGQQLSTGEKQLLAFTRVLCRNPAILVLDEATAAIDTESENILEQALTDSFAGRTSLIIAHRLSTIRRANSIIVMEDGKIVEQGSHQQLMEADGHYARLVEMDLKNGSSG